MQLCWCWSRDRLRSMSCMSDISSIVCSITWWSRLRSKQCFKSDSQLKQNYITFSHAQLDHLKSDELFIYARYNLARKLKTDSYGLVFGLNTFVALVLQSILTFIVADQHGFALSIRIQVWCVIDTSSLFAVYHLRLLSCSNCNDISQCRFIFHYHQSIISMFQCDFSAELFL